MTDIVARANLAALIPQYDSKAEQWWAIYGALLLADELGQAVALTQYHALGSGAMMPKGSDVRV